MLNNNCYSKIIKYKIYIIMMRKGQTMKYNIVDIIDKDKTNSKLKEIVNKKLYRIIELLEFNVNYFYFDLKNNNE